MKNVVSIFTNHVISTRKIFSVFFKSITYLENLKIKMIRKTMSKSNQCDKIDTHMFTYQYLPDKLHFSNHFIPGS